MGIKGMKRQYYHKCECGVETLKLEMGRCKNCDKEIPRWKYRMLKPEDQKEVEIVEAMRMSGVSPDEMLQTMVNWISTREQLSAGQHDSLLSVLQQREVKVRVFEALLALKNAERLHKALQFMSKIEDKLYDRDLANADIDEVLKLFNAVQGVIAYAANAIKQTPEGNLPQVLIDARVVNVDSHAVSDMPKNDRERMRELFGGLLKLARSGNNGDVAELLKNVKPNSG